MIQVVPHTDFALRGKQYRVWHRGERAMTQALRKHSTGCYRLTLSEDRFGQIRHVGREWRAEVRESDRGTLVRFAGIWKSLKDAAEELASLNPLNL